MLEGISEQALHGGDPSHIPADETLGRETCVFCLEGSTARQDRTLKEGCCMRLKSLLRPLDSCDIQDIYLFVGPAAAASVWVCVCVCLWIVVRERELFVACAVTSHVLPS